MSAKDLTHRDFCGFFPFNIPRATGFDFTSSLYSPFSNIPYAAKVVPNLLPITLPLAMEWFWRGLQVEVDFSLYYSEKDTISTSSSQTLSTSVSGSGSFGPFPPDNCAARIAYYGAGLDGLYFPFGGGFLTTATETLDGSYAFIDSRGDPETETTTESAPTSVYIDGFFRGLWADDSGNFKNLLTTIPVFPNVYSGEGAVFKVLVSGDPGLADMWGKYNAYRGPDNPDGTPTLIPQAVTMESSSIEFTITSPSGTITIPMYVYYFNVNDSSQSGSTTPEPTGTFTIDGTLAITLSSVIPSP